MYMYNIIHMTGITTHIANHGFTATESRDFHHLHSTTPSRETRIKIPKPPLWSSILI